MTNWIVTPVRNNLHLTRKAIETFRAQDIGDIGILIINNQSTDGTVDWLKTQKDILVLHANPPMSVAQSWNTGLRMVLDKTVGGKHVNDYCLVVNNDTELLRTNYRLLVEDGGLFVTGVGVREWPKYGGDIVDEDIVPDKKLRRPHPDFSNFLIRREAWEKVGPFDEEFKIAFCEDGDMDLRLYKAGIRAYCLDLPFLHHGSMTIKNADPVEVKRIQVQAEKNREYFKTKWGFSMASEEYYRALGKDGPGEYLPLPTSS